MPDAAGSGLGVGSAEEAVGAEHAAEDRHRAEGELAVRRVEVEVGLAAEHLAALIEFARVGLEAVFKDEADLVAVAEVFGPLDAEAGAEFTRIFHRELAVGAPAVGIAVDIGEAEVDQAVDLDVSGKSRAGKGRGERKGEERLFHFLFRSVESGRNGFYRTAEEKFKDGSRSILNASSCSRTYGTERSS